MTGRFRALRNRNFRLWMSGTLVSNVGTWMQRTAQDWLVLVVLTHHSGLAVGVTTALQFLPILLFSAYAGVLADRLPKRRVLFLTQSAMGLTGLALGLLVVTHTAQLWSVFGCAFLLGAASSLDNPTRLAFISEVVDREDLTSAVGLRSTSFNLARLVGPGLTGVVIAHAGTGPAFLLNAASFGAVLVGLAMIDPRQLHPAQVALRGRGQVREGMRYARGRPDLLLVFTLTAVVATLGLNFQLTNALMSTGAFHRGPTAYGLLGSMIAVGSLTGALVGARRERPRPGLLVAATVAFGVLVTVSASVPFTVFAVLLVPVGFASMTFLNTANVMIQMTTPSHMRGRILALYVAVRQGTTPIGAPMVGWVGGALGARSSVLVGGVAALVAGAAGMVLVLGSRSAVHREFTAALAREESATDPGLAASAVGSAVPRSSSSRSSEGRAGHLPEEQ